MTFLTVIKSPPHSDLLDPMRSFDVLPSEKPEIAEVDLYCQILLSDSQCAAETTNFSEIIDPPQV